LPCPLFLDMMILLFWLCAVGFVAVDFVTKVLAKAYITPGVPQTVIQIGERKILWFTLHYNTGAAFSSFTGQTIALSVVSVILLAVVAVYFYKTPKNTFTTVVLAMIFGGGVGNLIDRIAFRQVTDFINLFPFNFIFNCADIFVVIGAILICIYGVFFDKSASEKKTAADEAAENSAE